MLIKEFINCNLYDENEQVVILRGDVNYPTRLYTGYLCEIPDKYMDKEIWVITAMSETRRALWTLNKNGWTEIWLV